MPTIISWLTESEEPDLTAESEGIMSLSFVSHELRFDADMREQHSHSSVLTEHTVEDGAPLTDHKRANNDTIVLEALVTDTPIGDAPPSGFGREAISGSIRALDVGGGARANVLQFDRPITRVRDVHDTLIRLSKEPIEITLTTGSRTYTRIQVESAEVTRESGEGGSCRIEVRLRELRIATTRTATAEPREPRRRPRQDRAQQEPASAATPASVLQTTVDEVRENGPLQGLSNVFNNLGGAPGG